MGAGFSSLYRGLSVLDIMKLYLFTFTSIEKFFKLYFLSVVCLPGCYFRDANTLHPPNSLIFTTVICGIVFISGKSLIHKVFTSEFADSECSENSLVPKMAI